jgi:hypothetical protein
VSEPLQLRVELPEKGIEAIATLYTDAAPTVSRLVFDSVRTPLSTRTAHACFDGHEVYCFLEPFPEVPPLENRTIRPQPGEVMFFYAGPNDFVCTREDRLSGGAPTIYELAFMYGEVDLRHYWEEGFHGTLVGRMTEGADAFAAGCAATLSEGSTALRVSQVSRSAA